MGTFTSNKLLEQFSLDFTLHTLHDLYLFRSRRSQMFLKIGIFKNFAIFTGKNLHISLFLIKRKVLNCKLLLETASHQSCFVKKAFLKNTKFHRKTLTLDSLFNKVADLRYFPVKFRNFYEHLF